MNLPLSVVRISKSYTENEAAEHCGVSTEEMKAIEADPIEMSAVMAMKLRRLYGIPIDYISI